MKIASDMSSYFAAARAGSRAGGEAATAAGRAAGSSSGAGTATFSAAARDAAAATGAGTGTTAATEHPSRTYQRVTLRNAQADPDYARKAAHHFAHNDSYMLHGPLMDISREPIRYSATGEVVTDEGLAAFKSQARQARDELIALYQSEKAKGTPDAAILEKLFRARDAQPDDYLQKLNWARAGD